MNKLRRKRFSRFNLATALQLIGTNQLNEWSLEVPSKPASELYRQIIARLKSNFDLSLSEAAKTLLIDAFLAEAIIHFEELKIWKEAGLQTDTLIGTVDYLIAPQGIVYQSPLLCVIKAKKDNFEKGLAQCLVEMDACRWYNRSLEVLDIYGIITNATLWQFYKLTPQNEIYESIAYSQAQEEQLLGILHWLFTQCLNHIKFIINGVVQKY